MKVNVKCTHCGNEQEYIMRNKIPKRPNTNCKECGKTIYINKEQLTETMTERRKTTDTMTDEMTESDILTEIMTENTQKRKQSIKKAIKGISEIHRQNAIKGVKYFLSAWKSRYERNLGKPYRPVVDDYESMIKTLEFLEEMKEND